MAHRDIITFAMPPNTKGKRERAQDTNKKNTEHL